MTRAAPPSRRRFARFRRSEDGAVTIEFLFFAFAFFMMLVMIFEIAVYSLTQLRLDNALDKTARDVRIGLLLKPTHDELRTHICGYSKFIENCEESISVEMIRLDPRNFVAPSADVQCIDREEVDQPATNYTDGDRNELMLLRVCASVKPVLRKSFVTSGMNIDAFGEYNLVAVAGYVMEPL